MKNCNDLFSVYVGIFFQNDLVETETDMIHSQGCDIRNIILGDIAFKMLHIPNGDNQALVLRKNVKSFIIGQPTADSHAFL